MYGIKHSDICHAAHEWRKRAESIWQRGKFFCFVMDFDRNYLLTNETETRRIVIAYRISSSIFIFSPFIFFCFRSIIMTKCLFKMEMFNRSIYNLVLKTKHLHTTISEFLLIIKRIKERILNKQCRVTEPNRWFHCGARNCK